MKKYLALLLMSAAIVILPAKASAQWGTYGGGAYFRYAIESQRAKATRAKSRRASGKKAAAHKTRKKASRPRTRRTAVNENSFDPRFRYNGVLIEKSYIG